MIICGFLVYVVVSVIGYVKSSNIDFKNCSCKKRLFGKFWGCDIKYN